MKQMLLFVFLLASVSISYSMDKIVCPADKNTQSDVRRVMPDNGCPGCYFGASVPACQSCMTKRNSTPQVDANAAVVAASIKRDLTKSQEMIRCP